MKKILLPLFALLWMGMTAGAADPPALRAGETLSLARCVEIALAQHPDIAASRYNAAAKEALIGQTGKEYYPKIDVSAGLARYRQTSRNSGDAFTTAPLNHDDYASSLTLNQNLYDFGRRETGVRISELGHVSALADLDDRSREVAGNVRDAYYGLLKSLKSREIQAEKVENLGRHLDRARLFFQSGARSRYEVTKAEVDLSDARMALLQGESDVQLARLTLNHTLGLPDAPAYELEDVLAFTPFGMSREEALQRAREARPDLKSLATQLEAAERNLVLAEKERLPTLRGNAGYVIDGSEAPLSQGWNAGVTLSVTLFEGYLTKHKAAEARARIGELRAKIAAQRLKIDLEVKKAFLDLERAQKSLREAEIQVRQATENLELTQLKYAAGLSNPLEVSDANQSYSDAKLGRVKALYDCKKAEAGIVKTMGEP